MSAFRLIGLTCAAAELDDHAALESAFEGMNPPEAAALGAAAGALLARQARDTGDWRPWARIWWHAELPGLQWAAASWRARLDASAGKQREWEIRTRWAEMARVEQKIRRAVRPLLRAGAPKATVEEAAGQAAGNVVEWPRIFQILCDELDHIRQPEVHDHG
jgi:hypothetical protein